ncbi:uncharacterized protein EV154DRAFT_549783 [Mucor mucedo]|uniref:uncharacterized protein n=1 Tax=Mucor mucedo TaxID=29922 RepID=UPI00221FC7D9|nr:uncharacterized protein EV154DRAFT_549783 [Mucor mucedo]KAI7893670.1 hypothetical protein EV154DRAFT_549783 [Mucor mucedo]
MIVFYTGASFEVAQDASDDTRFGALLYRKNFVTVNYGFCHLLIVYNFDVHVSFLQKEGKIAFRKSLFGVWQIDYVASEDVIPIYAAACGYLAKKIYCVGGLSTAGITPSEAKMNILDIIKYNGSTAKDFSTQWETITDDVTTVNLEPRRFTQNIQYPDGESMLISGGLSSTNLPLKDPTVVFNGKTRSWSHFEHYEEYPYGIRQIYHAASVYVPGQGVGFFGGMGGSGTNVSARYIYQGEPLPEMGSPNESNQYIGYTNLTFFNRDNKDQPWSAFPTQIYLPGFIKYQQAIFNPKTNTILFFGGSYLSERNLTDETLYTLEISMVFNMQNGHWGDQELLGIPPSPRIGHSVTLITSVNSNRNHVLLYGGHITYNDIDTLVSDYCFTLDLDIYQWTRHDLQADSEVSMFRTQHSALSINNDTVFIVSGRDSTKNATLVPIMLNVTDPTRISLLDKYTAPYIAPEESISDPQNSVPEPEPKLSSGVIIGISVGCTAMGCISIAALLLWIHKKRSKHQMELMEVDWDEIDQKYAGTPLELSNNSSAGPEKPDVFRDSKSDTQVPGSIEDTTAESKTYSIQKPDGF